MSILIISTEIRSVLFMFFTMADAILSREEWIRVMEKRLESKDFEVLTYKLNPNNSTSGFLGDHYTADITVRLQNTKKCEQVFHFFVKAEPKIEPGKESVTELFKAFKKEGATLGFLFDKIRAVLKDGGKNMVWACNCYYVRSDLIVQEDLSEQGFRPFSMRDPFDYNHFAMTMKVFANMHAASIIFEEKQSSHTGHLNTMFPEIFEETLFINAPDHHGTKLMNVGIDSVLLLVDLIHGKECAMKVKDQVTTFINTVYDLEKPSKRFRNVLSQGDVKRDNFLYRHEGDVPVDARIVDYQLTRYVPPANDVMCFLYLSGNKEFRRQHTFQLLTVYYEQLSKNLQDHGLNPEEILSWEAFRESCDVYKNLGLIMATLYFPVTLISGDNIKEVQSPEEIERLFMHDRAPEVTHSFNTDDFYKKKITEMINEILEECVGSDVLKK